jgi:hypothetical protein
MLTGDEPEEEYEKLRVPLLQQLHRAEEAIFNRVTGTSSAQGEYL